MSRIYKLLMVEDEPLEAQRIAAYIERYGRERGIEFEVAWERMAGDLITEDARWDLVFMDIDLPGMNGMEAARLLRVYDSHTPIIFVTNLAQYAVQGYEVDALDFMVKPVGYFDFALRVDRAMRRVQQEAGRNLLVPTTDGTRVVPLPKLTYIEALNHNLVFHLTDAEPFKTRSSLKELEEKYADTPLVRISKGCMVNMDCIDWVRGAQIRTLSGDELTISRSLRKSVGEKIARHLGGR